MTKKQKTEVAANIRALKATYENFTESAKSLRREVEHEIIKELEKRNAHDIELLFMSDRVQTVLEDGTLITITKIRRKDDQIIFTTSLGTTIYNEDLSIDSLIQLYKSFITILYPGAFILNY